MYIPNFVFKGDIAPLMRQTTNTMSININQVIIVGYIGGEPKLKQTQAGTCLDIVLGVPKFKKRDNKWERLTQWFNVGAWNTRAEELHKALSKGDTILVRGKLKIDEFITKDGVKVKECNIVATNVDLLKKRVPKEEKSITANEEVQEPVAQVPF